MVRLFPHEAADLEVCLEAAEEEVLSAGWEGDTDRRQGKSWTMN